MTYTLGQAAKACGKSKATLSKAVKLGKISVAINDDGSFSIEPVELFRIYPPVSQTVEGEHSAVSPSTAEKDIKSAILQAELAAAKDKIDDLKSFADTIMEDRDHWRQMSNRLLSAPPKQEEKKGFWDRIRGK